MAKISDLFKRYEDIVEFAGLKLPAKLLFTLTVLAACLAVVLGAFLDITLGILLAAIILDAGFGVPIFLADRKVDVMESRLPDVLHHMGTTLKTGGTIEVALREVSRADYGPITHETKVILNQMNEGKPFEDAFTDFALRSRSEMIKRTAIIIIAARRAGGGLIDTLTAMAEDIRSLSRLKRERKTKTFMQFLFIIVAGCLVAPFVFAIVKSVLELLLKASGPITETAGTLRQYDLLFKSYIIIESALTTLGAVMVREGKFSKSIIYLPAGMLAAYIIYTFAAGIFLKVIGG